MLKSAILITTAIASILSIISTTDVRANAKKINHYSIIDIASPFNNRSNFYLTAKKTKSGENNIPKSDMDGIYQSISQHYQERNKKLDRSGINFKNVSSVTAFFVVDSLKLISFLNGEASIESKVKEESYSYTPFTKKDREMAYKRSELTDRIIMEKINLKKIRGKWLVTQSKVISVSR
jgi:hypothetical protein